MTLRDGRSLGYCVYGDPAGRPVIALHGTPGSRLKFAGMDHAARACGLALFAVDRWGYGLTDAKLGGRLIEYADDVAALADELGYARFGVLGVSGGGPYAVAVASCLTERVDGLGLVAPVGLVGAGAARPVSMSAFHRFCFRALPRVPGAVAAIFRAQRWGLRFAPELATRVSLLTAPLEDRRIASAGDVRAGIVAMFAEGLRPGVLGPVIDLGLFGWSWDVVFGSVRAPTHLWVGSADRNVPVDAVIALHEMLPMSRMTTVEGAGHLWLTENARTVVDWFTSSGGEANGASLSTERAASAR